MVALPAGVAGRARVAAPPGRGSRGPGFCVSGNFKSKLCWFEASFERFSFAQGSPSLIDFNHCTVVQTMILDPTKIKLYSPISCALHLLDLAGAVVAAPAAGLVEMEVPMCLYF